MAIGKDGAVVRHLRTLFSVGAVGELTDGQLLERFATDRGEAAELAFAVLVERHGPMVLRVCRGVLADPHDTQDAFQATFLVLVKKARALWVRDSLGPWLHQVAYRTATSARSTADRRRRHERRAAEAIQKRRAGVGDDLGRVLHEEINRLPERYRAPVILCDLEGRTHEQAARHLGWPIGTVKSRQARGRDRLRDRLRRRGLAPDAGVLAATLRPEGAEASVSPALIDATTNAVVQSVTVPTIVREGAAILAQGVLRAMSMTHWLKVGSVLLALGATASGVDLLARKGISGDEPKPQEIPKVARADDLPATAVKPGPLSGAVVERGTLESSENKDVFCKVEGSTTIIFIVREGTRVTKGQLVCELDSSALVDQLKNQRIATLGAEAAYQNAKLTREVAEIAVVEYEQGFFKQEWEKVLGEIALAETGRKQAEDRLERTRRARQRVGDALAKKGGAATPAEIVTELDIEDRLEDTKFGLDQKVFAHQQAQTKKIVLEKLIRAKKIKELKTEVERARSDELAKQQAWELEKDKEAKLVKQIENCKLLAPGDGMVVYANDPNRFGGNNQLQIEEGASVRERQKIFSLPDISKMRMNAKVHESMIDRVTPGQPGRITVDAFPGEVLTGVVEEVAPLPDHSSLLRPGTKVYTTRVSIENPLPGLRPGMTARVEIRVPELDLENVLSVPFRAVLRFDDKDYVAVKKPDGGFEWREVILGQHDGKSREVKEGLKAGELVLDDPRALMSDEEAQAKSATPPSHAPKAGLPKGKGRVRPQVKDQ